MVLDSLTRLIAVQAKVAENIVPVVQLNSREVRDTLLLRGCRLKATHPGSIELTNVLVEDAVAKLAFLGVDLITVGDQDTLKLVSALLTEGSNALRRAFGQPLDLYSTVGHSRPVSPLSHAEGILGCPKPSDEGVHDTFRGLVTGRQYDVTHGVIDLRHRGFDSDVETAALWFDDKG